MFFDCKNVIEFNEKSLQVIVMCKKACALI